MALFVSIIAFEYYLKQIVECSVSQTTHAEIEEALRPAGEVGGSASSTAKGVTIAQ